MLREELLTAAEHILSTTGREDAVTLRAVARGAGVTAPSIYVHFDSSRAILDALVARTFEQLTQALEEAQTGLTTARDRLIAQCEAYLVFAANRGNKYRVLFGRDPAADQVDREGISTRPFAARGQEAFEVLLRGLRDAWREQGVDGDVMYDATLLWATLHGWSSLKQSAPAFPWPGDDRRMATVLVERFGTH